MLGDVLSCSLLRLVYLWASYIAFLDTEMPRVRRAVTLADESSRIFSTPDTATTKLGLYIGHLEFIMF